MADIYFRDWVPYSYGEKPAPALTAEIVNRIQKDQWPLFNTASYMIIYNGPEGGAAFASSTANSNKVAGKMWIKAFTSEAIFREALEDATPNVYGIYEKP